MKLSCDATGVFPIAPTPFHPDGRVDDSSLDRLADFYMGCGVTGVTVLGQLGEAPKLEHHEAVAIAARAVRKMPVPVVVGVSAPGFAGMRALTREVMDAGAAGVMIAPPNTLRTDDQIAAYYAQAAESVGNAAQARCSAVLGGAGRNRLPVGASCSRRWSRETLSFRTSPHTW